MLHEFPWTVRLISKKGGQTNNESFSKKLIFDNFL